MDVSSGERAEWVQAWAAVVAGLVAIVVLAVAYSEFRHTKRVSKVEKTQVLWERFNSLEMLSARAQAAKLHPKGSEPLFEVFSFFESLARADELEILAPDDVDYYFRDYLLTYWYAFNDWVKTQRVQNGEDPSKGGKGQLYGGYQRLVAELLRQPGVHPPTNADIENFLKFEQNRFADAKAVRVEAILSAK